MALTPEQRRRRQRYLGSSDIPALFGLDPYKTRADVYYTKVLPLAREAPTSSTTAGTYLEEACLRFAEDTLGPLERSIMVVHPNEVLAANLDAQVIGKPEAVEAKYDAATARDWGQEGTDEVPARVLLQCQAQILAAHLECVWVPALVLGYRAEFRLYRVAPHDTLQELIEREALTFWEQHVVARQPPDNVTVPPLALLKRLTREPERVIDLPAAAATAWDHLARARAVQRQATLAKDEATALVLAFLEDAEVGRLPDGRLLTYLPQRGAPEIDHVALRAHLRESYADFVTERAARVLRLKDAP